MLMKQWALDVWGDKYSTTDMCELQMTCTCLVGLHSLSCWVSSSVHNACWFDGCVLDFHMVWLLISQWTLFVLAVVHSQGEVLITSMTIFQSYELSDSHKVPPKHWWPALMVHDCSSDSCQVRRLFCPAAALSLCYPVVTGQARVGLICTLTPVLFQHSRGHSRIIKYSGGWELGAGSPQAVH